MTDPRDRPDLIRLFRSKISRLSVTQVTSLALVVIAVIGIADYATGYNLSFGLFYVAPVAAVSWYVSRRDGLVTATLSAMVWLLANSYSAPPDITTSIIAWNTMIRFGFFAIIASLMAALRAAQDRENLLARTDSLTGLMNGRAFREVAERELARARRAAQPLTLLYLDLDNFKTVNDRRGHAAGDALLVGFARTLESVVRETDIVSRVGGDEFAIMLPDTSEEHGSVVATKIREVVRGDLRFSRDGVTVSVGVAAATESPLDALISDADAAMYEAKAAKGQPLVK